MLMPVPITTLYAALQGLVMFGLLIPLGRLRARTQVSIYDGGNPELGVAIRRHANWTEFVPFALLLLLLLELNGAPTALLHGLGATVMNKPLRSIGAGGTLLVILVAVVALLVEAL
jgi:hypothetical protein